jgi:glycine oxidase
MFLTRNFGGNAANVAADVAVAGAGIIGLSIALELQRRGARVTVLETDVAMRHASTAAAGMLAVEDPHNPPELLPLSRYSFSLYPAYLQRIERLSGMPVPFQTEATWQYRSDGGRCLLPERSVDPRQLAAALLAAVRKADIELHESVGRWDVAETGEGLRLRSGRGRHWFAHRLVHCSGAWFQGRQIVKPRKGQMLRVRIPASFHLQEVYRSENGYVVPRTTGPQAGSAVIGATLEDVGYDIATKTIDLKRLRRIASEMVPALFSETEAPQLEAWAGLRPGTADDLPLLGALPDRPRQLVATGHFRNGILLAPATAAVIADLVEGAPPKLSLEAFRPGRFLDL